MRADAPDNRLTRKPANFVARRDLAAVARRRTGIIVTVLLMMTVLLIGYVDYVSGPEIGFSLFYLAPVVAAAWYIGRGAAVLIALTAAACWFTADYLVRVSLGLSLWNGLTRLVIYTAQGWLVGTLREDRRREARLARTDAVTELPNSRAFYESLEAAARGEGTIGAMFIDLDNFKRVNDHFGHAAGDAVLKRVAAAMSRAVRETDIVARIGGDEFAALLHEVDEKSSAMIAMRIIEGIRAIARDYQGTEFGASIGIAIPRTERVEPANLIRIADEALYEAKQVLKGSFVIRNA